MATFSQLDRINYPWPKAKKIKQKYDLLRPYFSNRPDSNPIIFLHGICDTRKTWRMVAPSIVNKTGRKAYLLDARDHGESTRGVELSIEALTQDLVDFMDDRGIRSALLVGHSMGGRTAIHFALQHPERTEAVVVEDMSPRNLRSGTGTLFHTLYDLMMANFSKLPADTDLSTFKRKMLNFAFEFGKKEYSHSDSIPGLTGLDSGNFDESSKRQLPEVSSDNDFADSSKRCHLLDLDLLPVVKKGGKIVTEFDQEAVESTLEKNFLVQDLPQRSTPFEGNALFLYGDASFFNLAEDYSVKKLFPRATTQKIPNAMHLIHLQYPEQFIEAVSRFIVLKDTHVSKY